MTSVNRVILTGKVLTSPRRHFRPDGSPVIQFPLELNDAEESKGQPLNLTASRQVLHRDAKGQGMNRDGTGQAGRNQINIVAIGELAEFKLNLLQSGQPLMVIGRLNQRRWKTPEGRNRTETEVIATDLRKIEEKSQTQKQKK